jgi:hypothetical protein
VTFEGTKVTVLDSKNNTKELVTKFILKPWEMDGHGICCETCI